MSSCTGSHRGYVASLWQCTFPYSSWHGFASPCTVYSSCADALLHHSMPVLSLANGMWIGDIPLVLQILTLPKHILMVHYFPVVYIVKLYPMKKGAHPWSIKSLHSSLQGNVSTYCLNTDDIALMMDAQLMSPSSAILAATIGITFVGHRNLFQRTMPSFLHVNWHHVHDTLLWLKENNPIYQDIVISSSRLNICHLMVSH